MTDKDMGIEDVEETMKQTDDLEQQLELMMQQETQLVPTAPEQCVLTLLQSVSEVRTDYQQLRRELLEVQALQRELSLRLRTQLRVVHTKFARLRQRLAHLPTEPNVVK